jgi:hypothetical protein
MDCATSRSQALWIVSTTGSFHLPARIHEIAYELAAKLWCKARISRSPKTTAYDEITTIRSSELLQVDLTFDMSGSRRRRESARWKG